MNLGLDGKVSIVGGSSRGLGFACALALSEEGSNIVICGRDKDRLLRAKKTIEKRTDSKVLALRTDLSDPSSTKNLIDKTIKEFGRIDIFINNSGGPKPGAFFDLKDEDWLLAYKQILGSTIGLYKLIIPIMKEQEWGRIINITSLAAKEPNDSLIASTVFRLGVIAIAKVLSKEVAKYNILINNLCPGAFRTERVKEIIAITSKETSKSVEEIEKSILSNYPSGKYGDPNELASLVTLLVSERINILTGTSISIDGGKGKSLF
jgi:3-oxoacyl-[acyl-carrier protein] reductase